MTGKYLANKKKQVKNKPKRSCIKPDFINGRAVIRRPGRRQIIAVQRSNDDYKPFEPHAHVYYYTHEESNGNISSHFSKPEYLRRQYIASHHAIIAPAIRAEQVAAAIEKSISFIFVLAVKAHEQFGKICHTNNRAGEYNYFVHRLNMPECNVFLHVQHFSHIY